MLERKTGSRPYLHLKPHWNGKAKPGRHKRTRARRKRDTIAVPRRKIRAQIGARRPRSLIRRHPKGLVRPLVPNH
jgi:hypothetical protein